MAEGRFLSRSVAFNEFLGQVSLEADYLYMRMLPHLDRDGRISGSAKSLRARVCPMRADMTDEMVAVSLAELDQAKLIVWYEVDGLQCIEYPDFEREQVGLRKERESPSKVPSSSALGAAKVRTAQPIPKSAQSGPEPDHSGVMTEDSRTTRDIVSKGKLSKEKLSIPEPSTPEDAGVTPECWPKTWAYETSEQFLKHSVVMPTATCGAHAKSIKDKIPWSEWLRVVDRMAASDEAGYGLPALLRRLPSFRDDTQLDPNRPLTLEEALA